ncbi:dienelactone hydrolase family protein [Brachybacterium halotolerans subsp. kimchii]|uniref:alpha/beta hydrolase n=1 Tax=Brachybacterium halotolerans TaxID=2795215 RepID=UPI001E283377|nr:dienelactone hydrolase family protein [Brachybacterium halotolerans]UEJ81349.1 dienelactone hydrolase family protein [Brachybacterium halotolerans subsp. kimchii]
MNRPNPFGFPPVERIGEGPARIDVSAVRFFPHAPGPQDRVVILLHGLGSNEQDLLSLAPMLPGGMVYASLRGVLACGPGFAWLAPPPLGADDLGLLEESAVALEHWAHRVAPGRVIGAIGFSQGAVLALQLLRRRAEALDWAVALSGAPFPAELPGDAALAERDVPVLWGHGGQDPLFDAAMETQVRDWLQRHARLTEELSPTLGHGIDEQILDAVAGFVRARLAEESSS